MSYTFEPKQPHAKACGVNMRISAKDATRMSSVIRHKKLSVVKRLLQDLISRKRSLEGEYLTKTCEAMLKLVESCEANAKALGLDADSLFVHASATKGTNMRRGRRKSGFGARMRSSNVEIILVSRKVAKAEVAKKVETKKVEAKK